MQRRLGEQGMSHKALDVAHYIISIQGKNKFLNNQDVSRTRQITPLKLQKLLYYAQGSHLALHGRPLFEEQIEAWQHGPVVREVYIAHKNSGEILLSKENASTECTKKFSISEERLLHTVDAKYGRHSPWKLREMTHREAPWFNAYKEGMKEVISIKSIQDFFKQKRQAVLDSPLVLRLDTIMSEHEDLFQSLANV